MMRRVTIIVILLTISLLTGCFGPVRTKPKSTYTLSVPYFGNAQHRVIHHKHTVLVSKPTASPGFDSKKMIYNRKQYELSAFAENQWAGPPSDLLHPLIIQCLRNSGYFHAVVAPPFPAHRHYLLKTNLIELRQDFTRRPSRLRMAIQADLINKQSDRVVNSRVFSIALATPTDTPYGGVIAANRATTMLLRHITRFCICNIEGGCGNVKVSWGDGVQEIKLPKPSYSTSKSPA